MSESLIHDHAWALARKLVGIIENCLRPEEVRDAVEEFYECVREGLAEFAEATSRMNGRMHPMGGE